MLEHVVVSGPAAAGASAGAAIGVGLNRVLDQIGTQAQAAAQSGAVPPLARRPESVSSVAMQRREKSDFPMGPPPDEPKPAEASGGVRAPAAGEPAPPPKPVPAASAGPAAATSVPLLPVPPSPPPPPPRGKEELLAGLEALQPGATRDQVAEKLGAAAYKIAFDDGGHLVERLRFRAAGGVDVVMVELHDGVVQSARSLVR